MFIVFSGWATLGAGSAIPVLMREFDQDLTSVVNAVINWAVLLLGIGVHILNTLLFKLIVSCIDLFLGSCNVVFRHPPGWSHSHGISFCVLYLGSSDSFFQQLFGCTRRLRICHVLCGGTPGNRR